MDRLQTLIRDVVRKNRQEVQAKMSLNVFTINLTDDGVVVKFSNGRQQHISISQHGGQYRLKSIVLKRSSVEKIGRGKMLPFIWQRNRETNLVAFGLDKQNRLIGSIEQPLVTANSSEMLLYLERLAWECDNLEYLLSGVKDT